MESCKITASNVKKSINSLKKRAQNGMILHKLNLRKSAELFDDPGKIEDPEEEIEDPEEEIEDPSILGMEEGPPKEEQFPAQLKEERQQSRNPLKEYVTDKAPGPVGMRPIYKNRPLSGADRFWDWVAEVAKLWPTQAMRISIQKTGALKLQKKAYTYTAQLLSKMTEGLKEMADVESINWTASGAEAVISYAGPEGDKPQRYKVVIEPMDYFMRDTVWGPEGPPSEITNLPFASKLNLRKTAGWQLTEKGQEFYETARNTGVSGEMANVFNFIGAITEYPGLSLEHLADLDPRTIFSDIPVEQLRQEYREIAQQAIDSGFVTVTEAPLQQKDFDLPGNLPGGFANKLGLRKKAAEIGGVDFPDYTKDVIDAQSYIADRLWHWLNERHNLPIFHADDYYTYTAGPDKIAFDMANPEIQKMFQDAWEEWLEFDAPEDLRTSENMQKDVFNTVKSAFLEGYA